MPGNKSDSPRSTISSFISFVLLILGIILGVVLIKWLVVWLRRLKVKPTPVEEIELPPEPLTGSGLAPETEAFVLETPFDVEGAPAGETPAVETGTVTEKPPEVLVGEEIVSFSLPAGVIAPEIPDIYTPIPAEVFLNSDEDLKTADGKLIRYQFNWQNPMLMSKIYPFRLEKLRDFLLYYTEIDQVKNMKEKGLTDPTIQVKIEQSKAAMQAQRQIVEQKLNAALDAKKADDKWFARISSPNQKSLRFKQTYYINQQIQRAQDQLDRLQDRQQSLLKRVNWWPDDPDRQALWKGRAAELDPQINQAKASLQDLQTLLDLFDQEAELPAEDVGVDDVLHWELRQKKEQWKIDPNADALQVQNQLLKEIIQWIDREPDRFPEWLVYMVVHFSGMRYMSAHSSWAEPRELLEELKREDVQQEVKSMPQADLLQACTATAQRLQQRMASASADQKNDLTRLISRLTAGDRGALLQARTDDVIAEIQQLPDDPNDKACMDALIQYKNDWDARAKADPNDKIDPMPDWVWAEICKYTPLRLGSTDPNWDAYSNERWKWQNNRWREILATWEKKDVTSWRQKHRDTLELVVTRAVCNEIAEHIQDLRGLIPAAGLTAKPGWYLRQQGSIPGAYFKQAPAEADFKCGASILWLEWVDNRPNAWQVAHPLTGFVLAPPDATKASDGQPKGEISKKAVAQQKAQGDGWDYQSVGNSYVRQQPLPSRDDLRKQGMSDKDIAQVMAQRSVSGNFDIQYLRWRHEATVVGVYDMIDGRYVMTFETGQIGLQLRSLRSLAYNPKIFVGYVPDAPLSPDMDQRLVNMLRWDRILPGVPLPARPRPKKIVDAALVPEVQDKPLAQPVEPSRPALVIREDIRCYKSSAADKQGRPKMDPANPMVKLERGTVIQVSSNRKASEMDRGDGVINAQNGLFLGIVKSEDYPLAVGLYVRIEETADYRAGKWVEVSPQADKGWTTCRIYKGQDAKGKPILLPVDDKERRVLIPKGVRFRVSTTHKESSLDAGDGNILPSSAPFHYLVLECPEVEDAEGLYVEAGETVDSPDGDAPQPPLPDPGNFVAF